MSKNLFQQKQKDTQRTAREISIGCWWEFGQIKEVDEDSLTVRVIMFVEDEKVDIGWHPLRKGEGTIKVWQTLYGKIRKGMPCIIHYRGTLGNPRQGTTFIEIIGEGPGAGKESVTKDEQETNEKETGPYQLMSGGLA